MRKSWKWALCLGVVSLLLLGGCGKEKAEPVDLVLVTDGSEVASDAVYQSAWNGLAQYGDESGLKYEASVPAGRTTEDYENTIKEAAQKGASVIVCAGTSMSRAVYDAQRDWKDVRFLLLEAEPVSESASSPVWPWRKSRIHTETGRCPARHQPFVRVADREECN